MIIQLANGWTLTVDEGPEWLFFRLSKASADATLEPPLAAKIWDCAVHNGRHRLVFELDDQTMLTSYLVGQMVLLHKRAEIEGGVFRVCRLSEYAYTTLRIMKMADRFPNYRNREDAVMGHLPSN